MGDDGDGDGDGDGMSTAEGRGEARQGVGVRGQRVPEDYSVGSSGLVAYCLALACSNGSKCSRSDAASASTPPS